MAHRGSRRRSLSEAIGDLGERRQRNWRAFLASTGLADGLPASYSTTISAIITFAQPVLDGDVKDRTWEPTSRHWA
jgi:hypothetical protein